MSLNRRLERLESALRNVKPEIVFVLSPHEDADAYAAQQAKIEGMKRDGRTLILLTDADGVEAWEGSQCVFPVEGHP